MIGSTIEPTPERSNRKPGRPKGSKNKQRSEVYKRVVTTKIDDDILWILRRISRTTGIPFNRIIEDMALQFLDACEQIPFMGDRKQKYRGCSGRILRRYKQEIEDALQRSLMD